MTKKNTQTRPHTSPARSPFPLHSASCVDPPAGLDTTNDASLFGRPSPMTPPPMMNPDHRDTLVRSGLRVADPETQ